MRELRLGRGLSAVGALVLTAACSSAPAEGPKGSTRSGDSTVPGGCASYGDCGSCIADSACGWCGGSCTSGTSTGPDGTSSIVPTCAAGMWAYNPGDCTPATLSAQRSVCAFPAGAIPDVTLESLGAAGSGGLRDRINYIFVIVQENHSMDNMFAFTSVPGIDGLQAATHPSLPAWTSGAFALTTSCPADQGHQWGEMHDVEWHGGACDGFPSNGSNTMGFYQDDDHPFYTYLANNFATSDTYFGSALGGTWPNRQYLYMGTSDGVDTTLQPSPACQATPSGLSCTSHATAQGGTRTTRTTLFDQLDGAGVSWKYTVKNPNPSSSGLSSIMEGSLGWNTFDAPGNTGIVDFNAMMQSIQNPTSTSTPWNGPLPSVVFLDGGDNFDEHPSSDVHTGEQMVHDITQTIISSPIWSQSAILITYDEAGGYFDHVAPPNACPADPTQNPAPSAGANALNPRARNFNYLGFRVPLFVVSPYSKAGVSHVTHSHTSIARFIQARYGLPALTGRDANSDALLDMFDWSGPLSQPPAILDAWAGPGCATVANLP